MFFETWIALIGLLLLVPVVVLWADSKYQQARRVQRLLQRPEQGFCRSHGLFLCDDCFDL